MPEPMRDGCPMNFPGCCMNDAGDIDLPLPPKKSVPCRIVPEEVAAAMDRLVAIAKTIADRHAESKQGSGLLYLPVIPHEMKELRSALEPFRK